MKAIAIDVLLGLAVLLSLACCFGMLRMRDAYQKMHFMAPPASLAVGLIVIAIFLQQGMKPESFKALFIAVVLVAMNTVVTHATARAFRIGEMEGWRALPEQEVPIRAKDELVMPETAKEG